MRIFLIAVAAAAFTACHKPERVDAIFHNGTIYTVDSTFSVVESLAISEGTVVATGYFKELSARFSADTVIDLNGHAVYPGFIDAHCHFLSYGLGLNKVDLVGTTSWNEVTSRVAASANKGNLGVESKPPIGGSSTDWIVGRGWDQNDWPVKQMPDNAKLDSLLPHRPVLLTRIDGHAALASSEALRQAGITVTTSVEGGEFVKSNGRLTGLLIDNAVDFVKRVMPKPGAPLKEAALLAAEYNCLKAGLTTVDDAGLMAEDVELIDRLQKSGRLRMRVYAMLSDSAPNYTAYLMRGPYMTERLTVRSFKYYADGALGSYGACLLKPYSDNAGKRGFLLSDPSHFKKYAPILLEKGFQMNTHCIGDSAYRLLLDIYRSAGANRSHRWRIEHAQVVDPGDMEKSGDVIPSVQPVHATSDMYWAATRLGGERVKSAYAYKALLKAAGTIALGTDFPVEDISPFKTFYSAVARKDDKDYPPGGFEPANALSREEALRGMTIWAAYSNFEEQVKGSLEKGKVADFIVADTDLMKCDIRDVLKAKVVRTFIGGEEVYAIK
jgi:predicted amidohydrolase YtcJ